MGDASTSTTYMSKRANRTFDADEFIQLLKIPLDIDAAKIVLSDHVFSRR